MRPFRKADVETVLDILMDKKTAGILFAFIAIWEIRGGFLKGFQAYLKSLRGDIYLKILMSAAAVTVLLLRADELLLRQIQGIQVSWARALIAVGGFWGRGANTWGLLALIYFLSRVLRKKYLSRTAFGGPAMECPVGGAALLTRGPG